MHDQPGRLTRPPNPGESFDDVVLPHVDAAYRLARWLMRNEHDAEDAVQEASLRAFRYFRTFAGGDGRAWFLRIVRNTCSGWRGHRFEAVTDPFDEEQHRGAGAAFDPELLLLQTDDASLLARAITDELSSSLAGLIPTFKNVLPFFERLTAAARDLMASFAPSDDAKPADDRPNRNRMFLVLVNFQRSDFGHILLRGEAGVAAVGEHNDPHDDEQQRDNAARFHRQKLNPSARDEVDDQHNDRKHEQDVNKPTQCVGANQPEYPKHQQNNEYCPQHNFPPVKILMFFVSRERGACVFWKHFLPHVPCPLSCRTAHATLSDPRPAPLARSSRGEPVSSGRFRNRRQQSASAVARRGRATYHWSRRDRS